MAIKEIDPQEAYHALQNDVGCVYIDVRTVGEFVAGHPEGAVNIPVAIHDPAQGMVLNHEFVAIVEAHFPKIRGSLWAARQAPRSNAAARMLRGRLSGCFQHVRDLAECATRAVKSSRRLVKPRSSGERGER
jgi:hypothetical protein